MVSLIEISLSLDNDEEKEFREIITKDINYKEAKMLQSVEEVGMEKEAMSLILRQLNKKFKNLDDGIKAKIDMLGINELEDLGEALIDMAKIEELKNWLRNV